ncbi:YisL family protein [Oceanobacillus sp. Castelsardo]|uniref:YisL family protein n=1 Tax=Oceanobacillus sp. Castelsardo TaxID=1851204 RepID=UPI000838D7A4|nr:YisL family protein [Oceanobacillus sp. Castelsardo]
MTHMHITSWVLGFILFIIALVFLNQGKEKPAKIVHMILRLDYLFILYTGGSLLGIYFQSIQMPLFAEAITKSVAGIWLIAAMEMILVKKSKGKPVKSFWIQFVIALIIVLILGFVRLPM